MDGVLSEDDARKAVESSSRQKIPFGSFVVQNALAPATAVGAAAAHEFGIPLFDVRSLDLRQAPVKLVEEKLIQQHKALPLFKRGNRLFVGIADPTNLRAIDEIKFHTNLTVDAVIIPEDLIDRWIDQALAGADSLVEDKEGEEGLDNLDMDSGEDMDEGAVEASSGADDTPIVKFVNKVLLDAIKRGASDIHFEPYESNFRVRLRMDGILRGVANAPVKLNARISARLKVMAGLDIAERRVPQDGRIKLNISKTKSIDFRVSTCPTLFGEKIVLRILDASAARLGIDKLGYEEHQKALFLGAIQKPYGMVLVTGPTGSGKTVSLYTALNILNTDGVNISTVEDPVEIRVAGINQVQMNVKRGMTFAAALRSFLRQDPDIIMVGEIRDQETAQNAIQSALTGHLVFSTLHTNDAATSITRLIDLGLQPFLISSSLVGAMAQRLVRRICEDCKRNRPLSVEEAAMLNLQAPEGKRIIVKEGAGCIRCRNTGYFGRTGIFEILPVDNAIRDLIDRGEDFLRIKDMAIKRGMRTLRQSALRKLAEGVTSFEEVVRVTGI